MNPETNLTPLPPVDAGFAEVVGLIAAARQRAFQVVNVSLIDLYWQVGEYISRKIEGTEWGAGTVEQLGRSCQYPRSHVHDNNATRRRVAPLLLS